MQNIIFTHCMNATADITNVRHRHCSQCEAWRQAAEAFLRLSTYLYQVKAFLDQHAEPYFMQSMGSLSYHFHYNIFLYKLLKLHAYTQLYIHLDVLHSRRLGHVETF